MNNPSIRTHIMFPKDVWEGLDTLVGSGNRSRFVSEATRKELARLRLLKSARAAAGSLKSGHVPEWNTHKGTVAWVRSLRRAADAHMRAAHER